MNFIFRFAIWTVFWGIAGLIAGVFIPVDDNRNRSVNVSLMIAVGTIAGALGASAQEVAFALRDRK
jgi:hypothetical protein